jgi:hypothetical protein
MIPRFAPLAEHVPKSATVGYLLDESHTDPAMHHPHARFALAQFALAPRIVVHSTNCSLVIFDSDRVDATPNIAESRNWTLVANLDNGVRLYRNAEAER